ncbi:MAG: HAMP domain-containing histidine kinase [Armatimonadetes bacterium]|nr:HAMP domain-containing histidine kinase [Armatimonadota bacterium]
MMWGKKERERLERRCAELEAASELKTRAIANVSHELRTPLSAIVAYANMLRDDLHGPLTEGQREVVETVIHNADLLMRIINDLLDITRIESGKMRLTMTMVSLEECLESAWSAVRPALEEKGLDFCLEIPDEVVRVSGSFPRLRQVFVNLLANAVKFTAQGALGVTLRIHDQMAVVCVWDQGEGIPPESLPRIFDAFTQADDSIRRRHGGSGLGLAISKRLVEMHGGTIDAAANHPRGTRITVRLPLQG